MMKYRLGIMTYKGHLKCLKIMINFKAGYKKWLFNQNSFDLFVILRK